jgi:hypothetical protein
MNGKIGKLTGEAGTVTHRVGEPTLNSPPAASQSDHARAVAPGLTGGDRS